MSELIIRHTQDEMLSSLAAYLPGGELFESAYIPGTNFNALLAGLSGELLSAENFMFLYNSQFIPDETTVFIEEWESAVGIPDDCFSIGEDDTNEERRLNILVKLASLGVQTAADFVNLATILGFTGVEVLPGVGSDDDSIINGTFDIDSDWTKGTGWTISGGTANHVSGSASNLSQDVSAVTGRLYAITYDVLNLNTGTVTANIGGTNGVTRTENGSYQEVIEAGDVFPLIFPFTFRTDDPLFSMVADTSFDGSVDNITVRGSATGGSTPRFTIVVKFTGFDVPTFPLEFPIFFGDPVLGILVCLFTKLKPANCDIIFINVAEPPPSLALFAWGRNIVGQLGLGNTTDLSSPVQVGAEIDWATVSAGGGFSLAIKTDGTAWAWGDNTSGQLGLGNTDNQSSPVQIGALTDWATISGGGSHTLAIKTDGTAWASGFNSGGQLGLGNTTAQSSPVQIGALTDWADIASGDSFSLAIKTDSSAWAWGLNGSGRLGLGNTDNQSSPVQIGALTDWAIISTGDSFSLAIKTDGTAWAWGNNTSGDLGLGNTASRSSPVQIGADTDWLALGTGNDFSFAIKTNGTMFAWGRNNLGQLGLGNTTAQSSPVQVGAEIDWSAITAGVNFSLALRDTT